MTPYHTIVNNAHNFRTGHAVQKYSNSEVFPIYRNLYMVDLAVVCLNACPQIDIVLQVQLLCFWNDIVIFLSPPVHMCSYMLVYITMCNGQNAQYPPKYIYCVIAWSFSRSEKTIVWNGGCWCHGFHSCMFCRDHDNPITGKFQGVQFSRMGDLVTFCSSILHILMEFPLNACLFHGFNFQR